MPATLIRMSIRPNFSTQALIMASAALKSATLPYWATAWTPSALHSLTVWSAGDVLAPLPSVPPPRSHATMLAPSLASDSDTALPMPLPAPVTTAFLPLSLLAILDPPSRSNRSTSLLLHFRLRGGSRWSRVDITLEYLVRCERRLDHIHVPW